MRDLDLIPEDYRERMQKLRLATRLGLAAMGLTLGLLGAAWALGMATASADQAALDIQLRQTEATNRFAQFDTLATRKERLEQRLRLLNGLRSGGTAERIFLAVDRAIDEQPVTFTTWEFQRAGSMVQQAEVTRDTGYFIVVQPDQGGEEAAWKIESHMTIRGEATDHSALSHFVRALLAQQEVREVHVQRSTARELQDRRIVEFELAVILNTALRD